MKTTKQIILDAIYTSDIGIFDRPQAERLAKVIVEALLLDQVKPAQFRVPVTEQELNASRGRIFKSMDIAFLSKSEITVKLISFGNWEATTNIFKGTGKSPMLALAHLSLKL